MGAQFIPPKSARTSSVSRRELSEFQVCKTVRLASLKLWDHYSRLYIVHTETTVLCFAVKQSIGFLLQTAFQGDRVQNTPDQREAVSQLRSTRGLIRSNLAVDVDSAEKLELLKLYI